MLTLFNDSLVWLLKRRLARIEAFRRDAWPVQEREFQRLLRAGRTTNWGKEYGYRSIRSLTDFQRQIPVSTYEDLVPYLERVMQGEDRVLWPSPVRFFSKSSGTTNARSKFIPVSREALDEGHFRAGKDMMALWIDNKPETRVFEGKGLSVGGSLAPNPFNAHTLTGDISAIVMKNLPIWAQFIRTPSLQVALMDGWEDKIRCMAEEAARVNVTSILGVPTWILVLIHKVLELTGKSSILDVWPNFEVFIHGAVAFQPYRNLFQKEVFAGQDIRYLETYNASEGFFGLQDDLSKVDELLLMLDYGIFYEFIPLEEIGNPYPKALTITEVELNRNYALVITTNSGLWRYLIGDTIRFTSKQPYRIKISGRTKHFINAFGEEVIVENAETALTKACQVTGATIADYTAAPIYMGSGARQGRHEWVIEFSTAPDNQEQFVAVLDETLRTVNSDYDAKRSYDLALLRPIVHGVPVGTFYQWMKKRGKLGGQHKVPRLSNSREYVEEILRLDSQAQER
ncbi:MAG: GH3 auxin-responsive promoter family protein [Siphonobacter sp.]